MAAALPTVSPSPVTSPEAGESEAGKGNRAVSMVSLYFRPGVFSFFKKKRLVVVRAGKI